MAAVFCPRQFDCGPEEKEANGVNCSEEGGRYFVKKKRDQSSRKRISGDEGEDDAKINLRYVKHTTKANFTSFALFVRSFDKIAIKAPNWPPWPKNQSNFLSFQCRNIDGINDPKASATSSCYASNLGHSNGKQQFLYLLSSRREKKVIAHFLVLLLPRSEDS